MIDSWDWITMLSRAWTLTPRLHSVITTVQTPPPNNIKSTRSWRLCREYFTLISVKPVGGGDALFIFINSLRIGTSTTCIQQLTAHSPSPVVYTLYIHTHSHQLLQLQRCCLSCSVDMSSDMRGRKWSTFLWSLSQHVTIQSILVSSVSVFADLSALLLWTESWDQRGLVSDTEIKAASSIFMSYRQNGSIQTINRDRHEGYPRWCVDRKRRADLNMDKLPCLSVLADYSNY